MSVNLLRCKTRLGRVLARTAGVVTIGVVAVPITVVLPLRWLAPASTAFILADPVARSSPAGPARRWVSLDEISPHAALAVIASEDQRFAQHWGIDLDALRLALEERQRGGRLRGASTLSQQVAKNLFLWRGRSMVRKGIEAYLAVWVDALWPKRRIVEMYLNVAEFGEGIYGIERAAVDFFGVPAARLSPEQAALLAANLPRPRRWKDGQPPRHVYARSRWILQQMEQLGGFAYLSAIGVETGEVRPVADESQEP